MEKSLVPSLPAASFGDLEAVLNALSGTVSEFQVDFVDGEFAKPVSWPFTEGDPMAELTKLTPFMSSFKLEADCMVIEPEQYLDSLVAVGFKRIIVHFGSTDQWEQLFIHHRDHGYELGLAFTNDTYEAAKALIPEFDFVQVMGIKTVGQQGQPFDERTLETVSELRRLHPDLSIAIDGSVNQDTIPRLVAAGADRLAPGSAIVKASDPLFAYKQLHALL